MPDITSAPFLRVRLSQRPKDPSLGWVCGSDGAACDVVIGTFRQGVSRQQFSIHLLEEAGSIILINLSQNGTHIKEVVKGKAHATLL